MSIPAEWLKLLTPEASSYRIPEGVDLPPGVTQVEFNLGSWLSAALDDPISCQSFKDCIEDWFKELYFRNTEENPDDKNNS